MEERRMAKVIYNKSGGTGKGGVTNRVTIPTSWIKELGITEYSRDIIIELKDSEIVIKKAE